MNVLINPAPAWFMMAWTVFVPIIIITFFMKDDKYNKVCMVSCVALFIAVLLLLTSGSEPKKDMTSGQEDKVEETTRGEESGEESEHIGEEELEKVLTHKLSLPIDKAVMKVGKSEVTILDNFAMFLQAADENSWDITSRQNIEASISEYGSPLEFYLFEETEEGLNYYLYSYVENLSKNKKDVPLSYGSMTELMCNFDMLDEVEFDGFDRKSTYDDVVRKWGKEEYLNVDEYCWSTSWGHIFMTFNTDRTIHTLDLYIHSDYTEKALITYDEDTDKMLAEEVKKEKEAYEKRQEAADDVGDDSESDTE